jgi:hypothetical protein
MMAHSSVNPDVGLLRFNSVPEQCLFRSLSPVAFPPLVHRRRVPLSRRHMVPLQGSSRGGHRGGGPRLHSGALPEPASLLPSRHHPTQHRHPSGKPLFEGSTDDKKPHLGLSKSLNLRGSSPGDGSVVLTLQAYSACRIVCM